MAELSFQSLHQLSRRSGASKSANGSAYVEAFLEVLRSFEVMSSAQAARTRMHKRSCFSDQHYLYVASYHVGRTAWSPTSKAKSPVLRVSLAHHSA